MKRILLSSLVLAVFSTGLPALAVAQQKGKTPQKGDDKPAQQRVKN